MFVIKYIIGLTTFKYCLCASVAGQSNQIAPHWGYEEGEADEIPPEKWSSLYSACAGIRQSPILIDSAAVQRDAGLDPIGFVRYGDSPIGNTWTVVNNGHTVLFSATFGASPELKNGGLGAEYTFSQFHFHWGSLGSRGSEHVVNGIRYPLELHIVHTKKSTNVDPTSDSTALTVIGVLFEASSTSDVPGSHFDDIVRAIQQVANPDRTMNLTLPGFNLATLLPRDSPSYYRYMGSLTTPPCSEAVVWTVMKKTVKVTNAQLNAFRSLHRVTDDAGQNIPPENHLVDNFRPVQKLNGRLIRSYDPIAVDFKAFNQGADSPWISLINYNSVRN